MLPFLRLAPVPDPEPDPRDATGHIKVLLADDHAAMRQSLRVLLDGEADLRVVGEADRLESVLAHVRARQPDVLVLDLGLSSTTGLELVADLRRRAPDTRLVVLTNIDDPAFVREVLDHGALGLVLKEMADSDLPPAVRAACGERRYVSPRLAERLEPDELALERPRLTPREQEVVRLIALGHTSVEIAGKLGLSPRTVETHRARIHRKLGITTRAELVRYALRNHMMQLP
jgi:two-component system, NarL family, response regulator NreC